MRRKIVRREVPSASTIQDLSEVPDLLARVYAARGVTAPGDVSYTLNKLLPAANLKGLDKAVELLSQALHEQWHITIVGDFDADGATSTAVAMLALQAMGAQRVDYQVPNRFKFGYGLTPGIIDELCQRNKPDLIITVDNGISSLDGVAHAQAQGIKVLVTDHHLPGDEIPPADAIVNPNQPGCPFESKALAGVGVIFYVMCALRTHLIKLDYFQQRSLRTPNMADYLDIVAVGTVADVVPLDQNNRLLVQQGLLRVRAGACRPGITALLQVAQRRIAAVVASDFGFCVGPRLNAAGRLDDMSHGIECLLASNPDIALGLAQELNDLNNERKLIESGMQQQAMQAIEKIQLKQNEIPFGISLFHDDWHQGVIGIVAGRIKERFNRPVVAFAPADDTQTVGDSSGNSSGEIKGSARSIPGFHIRDALAVIAAKHPGLIEKYGGHAMAAGLSIRAERFPEFKQAFDEVAQSLLDDDTLEAVIHSDGALLPNEMTIVTADQLRKAGPWGQAFPEPIFDGVFQVIDHRILKEKHLKLVLKPKDGQQYIDAIAFNMDWRTWREGARQVRMAYRIDVNEFRGDRSVQCMIEYLEVLD